MINMSTRGCVICVCGYGCVGVLGCTGMLGCVCWGGWVLRKTAPSPCPLWGPQGLTCPLGLAAELEFVEITIIVVVVMVMVVVITCLLSHYKLSARSFIGRHSQGRRREDALSSVSA